MHTSPSVEAPSGMLPHQAHVHITAVYISVMPSRDTAKYITAVKSRPQHHEQGQFVHPPARGHVAAPQCHNPKKGPGNTLARGSWCPCADSLPGAEATPVSRCHGHGGAGPCAAPPPQPPGPLRHSVRLPLLFPVVTTLHWQRSQNNQESNRNGLVG